MKNFNTLLLFLLLGLSVSFLSTAQPITQKEKLLSASSQAGADFGQAVAIDGNIAIVGAYVENTADGSSAGAVYIYRFDGADWLIEQRITASDALAGDRFGSSVAIDGNRIIIGVPSADSDKGKAYIFEFSTSWNETAILTASDGANFNKFGNSVSISGDYAIVGASDKDISGDNLVGSAYIFQRISVSNWTERSILLADIPTENDLFGASVGISGDYAIVGVPRDDDNGFSSGSAYIFQRSGTDWNSITPMKLTASDAGSSSEFGIAVAIDGDYAVIGAYTDDAITTNAGAGYVFVRSGGNAWTEQEKLTATTPTASAYLGWDVDIEGDLVVLGGYGENSLTGMMAIYQRSGTTWTQQGGDLRACNKGVGDLFGWSVGISGNNAIIGAPREDTGFNNAGAAYIFWDGAVADQEINILGNGLDIPDGSTTPSTTNNTDFDDVTLSSSREITYRINNEGGTDLTIGAISITQSGTDFSIVTSPATTVAGCDFTTLTIKFTPSSLGEKTATINIDNGDADEGIYNFNIRGTGVINDIPATERTALIALYNATGGADWTNTVANDQPWDIGNATSDVSTWKGVTVADVSGTLHVTEIKLNDNKLVGNIPLSFWEEFSFLERINFSTFNGNTTNPNDLSASTTPTTINLSNLKEIDLGNSKFTDANFEPNFIFLLANIERIDLARNTFSNSTIPNGINPNNKLTELNLFASQFGGIIPSNVWQTSLVSITLAANNFTGNIDAIGNATNVQAIELYNNQLTGSIPASIGGLTELTYFNIGETNGGVANNFEGSSANSIPDEIGNLGKMEDLYLNGINLKGEIPATIKDLGFDGSNHNLRYINLVNNNLEGAIPTEIGSLISLEELYLSNNNLTGSIPTELDNLTALTDISLSRNGLSGSIPDLSGLINLRKLYLEENALEGSFADLVTTSLSNLPKLNSLGLNDNQLEGVIPSEINQVGLDVSHNLVYLNLGNNNLEGVIPNSISGLTALQKLYLFGNEFTGIPDLNGLVLLDELEIENNSLLMGNLEDLLANAPSSLTDPAKFVYSPQAPYSVAQNSYTVVAGNPVTLDATVSGTGIEYQWYRRTTTNPFIEEISGATSATYEAPSSSQTYFCEVKSTVSNGSINLLSPLESEDIIVTESEANALHFDGVDDIVTMHSDFNAADFFDADVTIEFWIKTSSMNRVIMSKWNEGTDGTFKIETTSEGKVSFTWNTIFDDELVIESDEIIADGDWHHIAITKKEEEGGFGSSYPVIMWVDALPQSQRPFSNDDMAQTTNPFILAGDNSGSLSPFEGEIDELRIWDVARSCDNIYSNLNNQINPVSESFLSAYYTFNQGTAGGDNSIIPAVDNLEDFSGNGRDGSLDNFSLTTGNISNWVTGNPSISGSTDPNNNPKLFLSGSDLNIENGDTTPSEEDGTDFGIVSGTGFGSFRIINLGFDGLNITNIESDDAQFTVTSSPPLLPLSSCSPYFLDIEFTPNSGSYGEQTATITIESNDGGTTSTYTFDIKAVATPQIRVSDGANSISSGASLVDFGAADRCNTITKTFTIENARGSELELYGNVEVSGNSYFEVTSQPTASIIDGVSVTSTEFTITYTPTEVGIQTATVAIYSNDENQNPFVFEIQGEGNNPPSPSSYSNYDWIEAETTFSNGEASFYDLKIAQDGTPYVAFQDAEEDDRTTVRKYNGFTWEDVGDLSQLPSGGAINQSLVIDKEDNVYVAYKKSFFSEIVVAKYDGSEWTNISDGGSSFASSATSDLQLALDSDDDLFLAYENDSDRAVVEKYDDDTWEVFAGIASDGDVGSISLAIDSYDYPIIAFEDFDNGGRTSVREYDGEGSWGYIGMSGFSSSAANSQSIDIDRNGTIYVTYNESGATKAAKYSETWNDITTADLPTSNSTLGNILVDLEGTPYITYKVADEAIVKKYNGSSWEEIATNAGDDALAAPVIAFNTDGVLHIAYQNNDDNTGRLKKYIPTSSEISVEANSNPIVDGSTTFDVSNNTEFGNVDISTPKSLGYTINNTGNTDLNIFSIGLLTTTTEFTINPSPPTSIAAFSSATFTVTFSPTASDTYNDIVTINTDNCENPTYTFGIQGTGLAPDILLQDLSATTIAESSFIDMGEMEYCLSSDFGVRIKNNGSGELLITDISSSNASDFAVSTFTSSIAPFSESTFTITFTSNANLGLQSSTISIQTNDPDTPNYDFNITGTRVNQAPLTVSSAPTDQTFEINTANCDFTNSSADIADVIVTDICNDAISYNYEFSGATSATSLTTLQNQAFALGITTVDWRAEDTNSNFATGTFTITVIDTREISVEGNSTSIANGDTSPSFADDTDFGDVGISTTKTVTYTIQNTGTETLNISSINVSTTPSEFTVSNISSLTVLAGESATFDVSFTPSTLISYSTTVTIISNDCEDGSYQFAIQGQGIVGQEINVTGNGNTIADEDFTPSLADHTIFPTTLTCGSASSTRTYTIESVGSTDLMIDNITLITPTGDFTLANLPTDFPSTPLILPSGETYSFDVVFNPSTTGNQTVLMRIENNDVNEGIYNFDMQGEGINDTQAPILVAMQDFTRNTNPTDCFYTNQTTPTTQQIPNGTASDNCRIASYNYSLSGATLGSPNSLEGIEFNTGVTTVRWTARDENGNVSDVDEFTVTVIDNQIPIIEAPSSISINADLYSCTVDTTGLSIGTPIVSDNCLVRVFNDAPALFPLGETTVLWTAIDSAGNTATDEQIVTVIEQFFVSPSDSLILVDIYNQTGGQNWVIPWDLTTPVSTWNGVGISCGQISSLDLSNNNLVGTLPISILDLSQLNSSGFTLRIQGNRLSFGSSENFVGQIPNFTYSPQAKIYSPRTEIISEGDSITFNSETEGEFSFYQWYKDQSPINGATSKTFTITNALPSDAGIYFCRINNSASSQLILERHSIKLIVEGFVNETDSLALVTVFNETGGNTTWDRPWDLTKPVATWEGVTLSGDKITELDLSSRNMTGTLPDVFDAELFSELRYLSFFDNDLEGQIPATVGDIVTLTYLDLDKNNFEGAVPASFGSLTNLQTLWLSRNNLNELPNDIGNLIALKNLSLNENNFTNLPETLGSLSNLLVLNVSDNQLTDLPTSITNLQKLTQLYVNLNFVSALPLGMENLTSLVTFEINLNNLSSLDAGLLELDNLKEFRVAENRLEFDDLLPFATSSFSVFDYAPQAPINEKANILVAVNSTVSFTIQTTGNGNTYQWLKDGEPISMLQNFSISQVQNTDRGVYTAFVKNSSLPTLTLERRSIELNIECQSGLSFEIEQPQQTTFCQEQPFGLQLAINADFTADNQIRWRKDGVILAFANENNYTVTQSGTYTAEVLTANGCTAVSNKIEITRLPNPEVSISLVDEKVLESTINTQEPVTYQWLKDGNPIENASENSYTPTETAEYSLLILTETGCTSVSETIIFTTDGVTGIEEPKELRELALFPNPNNGAFFIDFGTIAPNGQASFVLIDAIGRKINLKTQKISSTRFKAKTINLAGGIYYLQIQTKDGLAFRKFVIEE
ncbi:choice-of-anchor D domain-containing protein [Bernardetia sp. ABR2-2B]|uniref:choice-of-anchor D domain-containing protein n=1 Tax=Bernardetia sp. ABR2-2B TaxID=3127472 RepID=UPI0030CDD874